MARTTVRTYARSAVDLSYPAAHRVLYPRVGLQSFSVLGRRFVTRLDEVAILKLYTRPDSGESLIRHPGNPFGTLQRYGLSAVRCGYLQPTRLGTCLCQRRDVFATREPVLSTNYNGGGSQGRQRNSGTLRLELLASNFPVVKSRVTGFCWRGTETF